MRILVEMVDPRRVEGRGAPNDAMDFIPFLQEQIREVAAVLSSNPRDERFLHVRCVENRKLSREKEKTRAFPPGPEGFGKIRTVNSPSQADVRERIFIPKGAR